MDSNPKFKPGDRVLWRPDHDEPRRGEVMRQSDHGWIVRIRERDGFTHHKHCFEADLELEVKP